MTRHEKVIHGMKRKLKLLINQGQRLVKIERKIIKRECEDGIYKKIS
jgi:hypothetical protein